MGGKRSIINKIFLLKHESPYSCFPLCYFVSVSYISEKNRPALTQKKKNFKPKAAHQHRRASKLRYVEKVRKDLEFIFTQTNNEFYLEYAPADTNFVRVFKRRTCTKLRLNNSFSIMENWIDARGNDPMWNKEQNGIEWEHKLEE